MSRFAITAFWIAAFSALPATAAEVREETSYFDVRGQTLEQIDEELQTRGPTLDRDGARHPGATRVRFDGHVSYLQGEGFCRVDEARLSLDINMMLPRWPWSERVGASSDTAVIWRTISSDIQRHEQQHADIAREWLARMEEGLRALKPRKSCAGMEAAVNRTTERFLEQHEAAQLAFDAREGREAAERLQRALRKNRQAASRP